VAVRPSVPQFWPSFPRADAVVIGGDTRLRWRPAAAGGTAPSIVVRGWDTARASAATCRLTFAAR
jgi:hypothetical protein